MQQNQNLELNGHQNIPRTMLQEWNLLRTTVGKYVKNKPPQESNSNTAESIRFLHLVSEHFDEEMPVQGI